MTIDPAPDPFRPWPDELPWRSVSPRLASVLLIRLWVSVLISTAAAAGAAYVIAVQPWHGLLLAVAWLLPAVGVVRTAAVVRSVRAWGYAEREHDLLIRHGLLVRRLSIVPYRRMQYVDVAAGPLERAFGLATVQLHTAAAATDASIPGLSPAEASRLRDRLAALGVDATAGL